jgi:hypothetical protein
LKMALRFILAASALILHVIAAPPQAQAPLFSYTKAAAAVVQVQEQMLLIFNAVHSSMGIQLEQRHVALSRKNTQQHSPLPWNTYTQ